MKTKLSFTLLFFFLFILSPAYSGTLSKEVHRTFPFQMGGDVAVETVNGKIITESWDYDSVDVYAEIEVKAKNRKEAEDFLKRVEIIIDRSGDNRLYVESDYPNKRSGGNFLSWIFGKKIQVKVNFWIKVPKEVNLELQSVNGRVQAQDVKGDAKLRTTNGNIEAQGLKGSVDAYSVNGSIEVQLDDVDENANMKFKTTNGSIELFLPQDVKADIKASTVNGSVSTDLPVDVRGKFSRKKLRGKIHGGGGLISLHTINGSVSIYED